MNKDEKIRHLEKELCRYQDIISELEKLRNQREVEFDEIRASFDKNDGKILKHEIIQKEYEKILGGDGRGMPWSKMEKGNVLVVTISEQVYVSDENNSKLKRYIDIVSNSSYDNIEIN